MHSPEVEDIGSDDADSKEQEKQLRFSEDGARLHISRRDESNERAPESFQEKKEGSVVKRQSAWLVVLIKWQIINNQLPLVMEIVVDAVSREND